jgi:hypothetical protein
MIHGTCSLCGGPVTTPATWLGVMPPTPTCQRCGATQREAHGPVIDMVKRPHQQQGVRPANPPAGTRQDGRFKRFVDWTKVR